jgi:rod shape determining protein RodA
VNFDARLLRNVDYWLLLAVAALIVIGLFVIDSAGRGWSGPENTHIFTIKQAYALGAGLIAMTVILLFDYSEFSRMSVLLYLLNCSLLLLVLAIGKVANTQQGWIALGPFHLEPSEVGKVLFIMTLAHHLTRMERLNGWLDLIPPIAHLAPLFGLIMLQPDLGTALVFIAVLGAMLYVAGAPGWRLVLIGLGPLVAAIGWVVLHLKYGIWIPLADYQIKRLLVLVDPNLEPHGAGYQVLQSKISIGSGGLWGKGLYHGTQNQLGFLPEQHTDFIFAVVGEELGFLGGIVILALFLFILVRILIVAGAAKDRYGALLATGVAAMIGFHVLENIGMTIGVMPVTGIPLPFVSYGGSSLVANLMAIAMVQNVHMRRQKIMF